MFTMLTSTKMQKEQMEETEMLDAYLKDIAGGGMQSLEQLYHATHTAIYGFALSIMKNRQDAEDIAHDCYLSIFHSAANYRSSGKPMAWILTVTRNLCLHKLREHSKKADFPQEDWETQLTDQSAMTLEDQFVLRTCMEQLSEEERQIVVLHVLTGLKHREIAALLELPLPTVLSKYHRTMKKLKILLGGD